MQLYLAYKIAELRVDVHTFFRIAHQWAFGTMPDLRCDVDAYARDHKIPKYVERFVIHIQAKEKGDVVQTMQGADRGR